MTVLREILLGVDRKLLVGDGFELNAYSEQIVLLAQLHCLPSTVDLFGQLLRSDVGIRPDRVVVVPKPYSSIPSALQRIREWGFCLIDQAPEILPGRYDKAVHKGILEGCVKAFEICRNLVQSGRGARLVIVDDGGILTESWWRLSTHCSMNTLPLNHPDAAVINKLDVISVQQTTSGIRRKPNPTKLTKIDISRSAAKRSFESKIIAEGVLKKVRALELLNNRRSIGVVGVGALGAALARDLISRGFGVFAYDVEEFTPPVGVNLCASLEALLGEAEIIFGCSGSNILSIGELENIRPKKPIHFVSCSSRDIEFKDLLRLGEQGSSPFDRVTVRLANGQPHYIENGGFPINFDREEEQEGPDEIALTRALVFTGILQAVYLKKTQPYEDALMLSPRAQRYIVDAWMRCTGRDPEEFGVSSRDFASQNWWRENSRGWTVTDQTVSPFP